MNEKEIYKGMREEQLIEIILNFKSAFRELQKENAEQKKEIVNHLTQFIKDNDYKTVYEGLKMVECECLYAKLKELGE